jgi:quinol monooxygenase YgiN
MRGFVAAETHNVKEDIPAMSFIQIMQMQTSNIDEIRTAVDEWQKATEGKRTVVRSTVCQDRDNPGRYAVVVFFDSYEDAMKNSALAETDALSKKMTTLSDGPPTFVNLDAIEERLV